MSTDAGGGAAGGGEGGGQVNAPEGKDADGPGPGGRMDDHGLDGPDGHGSDAARQKKAAAHADQVATRFFNRAKAPRHRDDPSGINDLQFKDGDLTKRTYTFTCCFEAGTCPDSGYPRYEETVREFTISCIIKKDKKEWKLEGQINTQNDGTGSSVPQSHARW